MTLIELEIDTNNSFSIQNIMMAKDGDKIEKFYKVKLLKNNMNTQCLFSGKNLFGSSFNGKGKNY